MSLRFDRKASSKLRASFSCRSRTEKERDDGKDPHQQQDYLKSWSYRQCQFACDYLNLIEPPTLQRSLPSQPQQNKREQGCKESVNGKKEDNNGGGGAASRFGCEGVDGDSSTRSLNESSSKNQDKNKSVVDSNLPGSSSKTSISKPTGNMSALASLGSTVSIPASCVTTSSRSSFNSSIISTGSNNSSDSSSSNNSLYADLFELGFGPSSSSHLYRDMGTMKPADPFRFSQATLEDTQEDELNAILGELSALQMSLDREISHQPGLLQVPGAENNKPSNTSSPQSQSDSGVRTESPDNDSGFSDNASLLSSGSSLSASGSSSGSSTTSCGVKSAAVISRSNVLHATELAQFVTAKLQTLDSAAVPDEKAEKIRVALEKMRAASVTRLYVKAFTEDGSSKALMVEESMTCGRVLALLADKNHVQLTHKWTLVEHLPHLHMERIYEDHEDIVMMLMMWTRDSKNKLLFVEKTEKYDMFVNPQKYFMETRVSHSGGCMDDHTKNGLIEEFFAHGKGVPEVETFLYLKAEGKKAWKKFPFVLRASGIYYCPKGRTHANALKDLVCLATIDHNIQAYQGVGWRKKFKSPTEFGFALKPARLQVKSHRHMKYLCAEDAETLRLWMVGIRIAKYGKQLWDNYRSLMEDLAHEDLDRFGRSVSLASMPQQMHNPLIISTADRNNAINKSPARRYSQESYQSSGVQYAIPNTIESNRSNMPAPPPLPKEDGFENDCPMGGTIKRKPSAGLTPKIPLTVNTRSIVGEFINVSSTPGEGNTVTLQRKRSLSGNSSGSSCSSMVSQIHIPSKDPLAYQRNQTSVISQPIQGKPATGGTLTRSQPIPPPEPLAEETMDSLDMENLPPPPPELLNSESESSNAPSPVPVSFPPPPPPPPINNMTMNNSMQPNNLSNTINPTSCLKQSANSIYGTTTKRGVSFASELSERLKSRADNNNTNAPSVGRVVEDEQSVYSTGGIKVSGQKRVGFNLNNGISQSPSSPKKLEEPPEHFLQDLQRVMNKKWQVAQKCNADKNTTPHEILGFRIEPVLTPDMDLPPPMPVMEELNVKQLPPPVPLNSGFPPPPPPQCQSAAAVPSPAINSNLNNVEQWVSQHYGTTVMGNMGKMPPPPNGTMVRPSPPPVGQKPLPPQRVASYITPPSYNPPPSVIYQQANNIQNNIPLSRNNSSSNSVVIYENFEGRKSAIPQHYNNGVELRQKRPPPPVPKRAESTHLSAHIVFN